MRARLDRFDNAWIKATGNNADSGVLVAVFEVEKVYKGQLRERQEVKFRQGYEGLCGMSFGAENIGENFLFYVSDPLKSGRSGTKSNSEPIFAASLCSRSRNVKYTKLDLAYLDRLDAVAGRTRLAGKILSGTEELRDLSGIEVEVHNANTSLTLRTDAEGMFEHYGLPAGKYDLTLKLPDGFVADRAQISPERQRWEGRKTPVGNRVEIEIVDKRHTEIQFYVQTENTIAGKVVSPEGRPMEGVCVSAHWINPPTDSFSIPKSCTNVNGEFRLGALPSGEYALAVNFLGKLTAQQPFKSFYYPNTDSRSDAAVFTLKPGARKTDDLVIQVSKVLPLLRISGRVEFADGQPMGDVTVNFKTPEHSEFGNSETVSDENGRYSFQVPQGASGKVFATINLYEMKFDDCPKIKAVRKRSRSMIATPESTSNIVTVDGERPMNDAVLTFKIPPLICGN